MLNGSEIVVKQLLKYNISHVFGYSGGSIISVFNEMKKNNINFYINSHEQYCGYSATGYAKSSNKIGVCICTSGPSITNMITPILDANNDSTPLLVISGQVQKNLLNTGAFQESPATELTSNVTKWSHMVKNINELEFIIDKSFEIATSGRPGSVHIDIPKCILSEKTIYEINYIKNKNDKLQLSVKLDEIIKYCERPILLVGNGCKKYSELVTKIANKNCIPVTTTLHGVGIIDENEWLSLKFLGMHGSYKANIAIEQADCIIGIGVRFDDRIIGNPKLFAPNAHKASQNGYGGIINCNINKTDFNKTTITHHNICCDAGEFLKKLDSLNLCVNNKTLEKRRIWVSYIKKIDWNFSYKKTSKLKTQDIIYSINKYIPKDTFITTGVGNHQMMTAQFINWRSPKFITSGSLGVMGVGLPYAIGACVANPNNMVIDIDGDSSFNQTLSELTTVAKYKLPIKIAIMNDGFQSMVRTWEQLFFNKDSIATECNGNPDYDKLGCAYGIKSLTCDNHDELDEKIKMFIDYDGPIICNFKVSGDKCFPLIPPGKTVNDTLFSDTDLSNNSNDYIAPS